jgi:hypothetical protein
MFSIISCAYSSFLTKQKKVHISTPFLAASEIKSIHRRHSCMNFTHKWLKPILEENSLIPLGCLLVKDNGHKETVNFTYSDLPLLTKVVLNSNASSPQVKHDVLSSGIQHYFHNHHKEFVANHQHDQSEN